MKKLIFLIVFVVLNFSIQAQKVSNIRAEQRGQEIVVLYTLETTSPCEVSLLLSQDNGATWSDALKNVSGAVGKSITAGEKQIIWKVLEEREHLIGDKIKFKISAIDSGRKILEPEMVYVEGGTFQMGGSSGESDEKPVHSVTISSFNIGKYEVTHAQWKSVMGINPSYFKDCDQCPVESVSWNDVQDFILKLNGQTGKNYRLPNEAEWEYAAKGGNSSKGYTYSGSNNLNLVAWYSGNSVNTTHTVGGKQTNELGIYDMSGNVWEWCSDWYGVYNIQNDTNPKGAASGQGHVFKGGSWINMSKSCRPADRDWYNPSFAYNSGGFRLVLPVRDIAESKAAEDLESDARRICEFMNKITDAQKNNDLDKILLLQQQMEPLMSDFQRKYPKGSEDGNKMEALIKPCLEGFMDSFK